VCAALAAGILIAPTVLGEEPEARARVAILSSSGATLASPNVTRFVQELGRLGYVDGVNLTIESRATEDDPARLRDMARELVRVKPDVRLWMLGCSVDVNGAPLCVLLV